ncbi:DUF7538 family protein [Halosimplex pelagicum]|uniref:DUF7538 family protein n=1 Tax=Halosimplex pelagicum TaxID=869886 RepID=UPI001FECD380|nr:hypothetical protein [Halosimplex pelagicum]
MSEGGASGRGSGDGGDRDDGDPDTDPLARLADREGWRVEGSAARVHYEGEGDRYSVEFYAPSDCVVYWKVPPETGGETAVPVSRETVPTPLRERIRMDLDAAGVDPEIERRSL